MHPDLRARIDAAKAALGPERLAAIQASLQQLQPSLDALREQYPTLVLDDTTKNLLLEIAEGLGEAHFIRRRNHQRSFETALDQKAYAEVFVTQHPDEVLFLQGIISLHEQGLIEEGEIGPNRPVLVLTEAGKEAIAIVREAKRLAEQPPESRIPDPYFA